MNGYVNDKNTTYLVSRYHIRLQNYLKYVKAF